jgi:hypothetical protein
MRILTCTLASANAKQRKSTLVYRRCRRRW